MRQLQRLVTGCLVLGATFLTHAEDRPRTHNGFHLQLSGGLGYYSVSSNTPVDQSFSGLTLPTSLLMGGTLYNHLVIGAGIIFDYASSPTYKLAGMEIPDAVTAQMILGLGLYGDYYLQAQGNGPHFQIVAGWGGLETSFHGNVVGSDPTGLVTSLGGGYDWWISDSWTAGVMGRFLYASISLYSTKYPTIEPAIVGVLTWH